MFRNRYQFVCLVIVLTLLLLFVGCTANDPLTENLYIEASYLRVSTDGNGGYWREHNEDGINLSPGNSGATLITPNISTLGGWQLNATGEWLFFDVAIEDDYDGVGDAQVQIFFEVNDDNSGGLITDTVDFQLEFWCKQLGDNANTNVTYNTSTVVGQATQHDLFVATVDCAPIPNSLVSFRLELTVITSDVDDVIVNYVKMRYPVYSPALERN